ncbi:MAG: hypothetical protein KF683_13095 [Rubrivivax sp.]|nr:hypothetical protein [Rubrivivax sp.]
MPLRAEVRRRLPAMAEPGPQAPARLEAAGIASLRQLRQAGVDTVVQRIGAQLGTPAWRNRRGALQALLAGTATR